jgi:hypothetical protein
LQRPANGARLSSSKGSIRRDGWWTYPVWADLFCTLGLIYPRNLLLPVSPRAPAVWFLQCTCCLYVSLCSLNPHAEYYGFHVLLASPHCGLHIFLTGLNFDSRLSLDAFIVVVVLGWIGVYGDELLDLCFLLTSSCYSYHLFWFASVIS